MAPHHDPIRPPCCPRQPLWVTCIGNAGGPMVTRCHQIRRDTLGSVVGQNHCRSSASRTRHCEQRFLATENESFFDHQALVASVLVPFHPFPPGQINGSGYLKHGRNGKASKFVWNWRDMGVIKRKGPRNVEPGAQAPTMTETSSHLSIRASLTGLHAVDEVGPTELRGYLPTRDALIGHSQTLVFAGVFISFVVRIHGRLLVWTRWSSGCPASMGHYPISTPTEFVPFSSD
jgi:hypothetical protein